MEPPDSDATPRVHGLETALQNRMAGLESQRTRENTRVAIHDLFEFLVEHRDVQSIEDVSPQDGRKWAADLARRDEIAASTARTYYALARATFSWWKRDQDVESNPLATITAEEPLPADSKKSASQYWSDEARDQLLAYVDKRAHDALEESEGTEQAFRDRVLVYLLADTGVRGAEICSVSRDEDRNGLSWSAVNLEDGVMEVYGKSREYEPVSLPTPTIEKLDRWRRVQQPEDDWPVIPSGDATTKHRVLRETLTEEARGWSNSDVDELLEEHDIDDAYREAGVSPPALSTEGARSVMQRLCEEAGIQMDGEYLKPHGGRRALGSALYGDVEPRVAQEVLRHQSVETTHESYREIDVAELAEDIEQVRYQTDSEDSKT